MSLAVGDVFAGHTVLRTLGAGTTGAVYLVQHPQLSRPVALKVLSAGSTADPQYRARFLRDAEVCAGLSHPHILGVYEHGEDDGRFWISMDYVAGTDAAKPVRERHRAGMPPEDALQIITAVASALDHAHRRGLLHRNVKPANILLSEPEGHEQRILLADFGLAHRVAVGQTAADAVAGKAAYTAPEQLRDEPVYPSADQYSLACTAFHLLTGAPPYGLSSASAVINGHVTAPPPPIGARRPELSALNPVFARAMAKSPTGRFRSCQDFTRELLQRLS